jgi:cob(I)alamin adenosyltransferase
MPSKFYTRMGDDGTTGLLGAGRVSKADVRIEALGSVDEASAALGMARALCQTAEAAECLVRIQRDLYNLMGEVAATPENVARFRAIGAEQVEWLEAQADYLARGVDLPREFIIPGDSLAEAALDVARAERRLAALAEAGALENPQVLRYLNRLSSFCFVLELHENVHAGNQNPTLAREGK